MEASCSVTPEANDLGTRCVREAWARASRLSGDGLLHDAVLEFLRLRVLLNEQSRQLQSPKPLSSVGHEKVAVGGMSETAAVETSLARSGSSRRRAKDVVDMLLQKVEEEIGSHLRFLRSNHYAALQLPSPRDMRACARGTITDRTVKGNYRRLALRLHPDKTGGTDSGSLFAAVRTAYESLNTVKKRALYKPSAPPPTPIHGAVLRCVVILAQGGGATIKSGTTGAVTNQDAAEPFDPPTIDANMNRLGQGRNRRTVISSRSLLSSGRLQDDVNSGGVPAEVGFEEPDMPAGDKGRGSEHEAENGHKEKHQVTRLAEAASETWRVHVEKGEKEGAGGQETSEDATSKGATEGLERLRRRGGVSFPEGNSGKNRRATGDGRGTAARAKQLSVVPNNTAPDDGRNNHVASSPLEGSGQWRFPLNRSLPPPSLEISGKPHSLSPLVAVLPSQPQQHHKQTFECKKKTVLAENVNAPFACVDAAGDPQLAPPSISTTFGEHYIYATGNEGEEEWADPDRRNQSCHPWPCPRRLPCQGSAGCTEKVQSSERSGDDLSCSSATATTAMIFGEKRDNSETPEERTESKGLLGRQMSVCLPAIEQFTWQNCDTDGRGPNRDDSSSTSASSSWSVRKGGGAAGVGSRCVRHLRNRVSWPIGGHDDHRVIASACQIFAYQLQEEVEFWISGARREGVWSGVASKAPENCIQRDDIIPDGVDVHGPTAAPRGREELSHAICRGFCRSSNSSSIVCGSGRQSSARAPANETIPMGKTVVEESRNGLELSSDLRLFTSSSDLDGRQEELSANHSHITRESSDQAAIHNGPPDNVSTATHCFRGSATSRPVLCRHRKGAATIRRDASTDDLPKNSHCLPTGGSGRVAESRNRPREPPEDEIVSPLQCSGVEEITPSHGRGATGEFAPISDMSDAAGNGAMTGLGEAGRGWFWGAIRDC